MTQRSDDDLARVGPFGTGEAAPRRLIHAGYQIYSRSASGLAPFVITEAVRVHQTRQAPEVIVCFGYSQGGVEMTHCVDSDPPAVEVRAWSDWYRLPWDAEWYCNVRHDRTDSIGFLLLGHAWPLEEIEYPGGAFIVRPPTETELVWLRLRTSR